MGMEQDRGCLVSHARIGAESGFLRVAFCSGCGSEDGRQEERGLQHRRRLVPEIESLELPTFG